MKQRILLAMLVLAMSGCTSVYDLGGGRYMVPRQVEVRSPFGTNAGFVMLETCDGVPKKEEGLQPFAPAIEYVNCQVVKDWTPIQSQGQGGQIVSGVLQAGGLVGMSVLLPSSSATAVQSQSVAVPAGKSVPHK